MGFLTQQKLWREIVARDGQRQKTICGAGDVLVD